MTCQTLPSYSITSTCALAESVHIQPMSLSAQAVPPDIIYVIVNELRDDIKTLKNTSLVSNVFLQFSQVHIFKRVSLTVKYNEPANIQQPVERLLSALYSNPALASHIRQFRLSTVGEEMNSLQKNFLSDSVLVTVLRRLDQLESFTLHIFWALQTPVLRSVLVDLCRLESLRHIRFTRCIMFPIIILAGLPHIRQISTFQTKFEYYTEDEMELFRQGVKGSHGHLETLEFDNYDYNGTTITYLHNILTHQHSMLRISRLRVLKLNSSKTSSAVEAWKIMQYAVKTLECFVWDTVTGHPLEFIERQYFDWSPIDISQLPRLSFLGLSFTIGHRIGRNKPNTTWVIESLQRMAGQNKLKDFVLVFHNRSPSRAARVEPYGFLMQLDSLLTHGGFPYLTQVAILIGDGFRSTENMRFLLLQELALLRVAGILTVGIFSGWPEPEEMGNTMR